MELSLIMTRIILCSLFTLLGLVSGTNAAIEHTVTFTNVLGVGSGHTPDTGGRLVSTAQNFEEDGLHVEAFWAFGNLSGYAPTYNPPHFHHLENGYETSHGFGAIAGFADFQGIYIERLDGGAFDLASLDYMLAGTLQATSVLVSTTLNPRQPILPQFTAYPVTRHSGFTTLEFDGFKNITSVFISSILDTSSLSQIRWDNIVVQHAPEASSLLVWSLLIGAAVVAARSGLAAAAD